MDKVTGRQFGVLPTLQNNNRSFPLQVYELPSCRISTRFTQPDLRSHQQVVGYSHCTHWQWKMQGPRPTAELALTQNLGWGTRNLYVICWLLYLLQETAEERKRHCKERLHRAGWPWSPWALSMAQNSSSYLCLIDITPGTSPFSFHFCLTNLWGGIIIITNFYKRRQSSLRDLNTYHRNLGGLRFHIKNVFFTCFVIFA